eukprot:10878.XXX_95513_95291_1 [CDS] Oithona nana genome sequencing.
MRTGITQPAPGPITRSQRGEPNPNRVVVSEPVDRNLEAARYLSDDQPARI